MSFDVNDNPAAGTGMNGFVGGQAVVKSKQVGGGLPFERAAKLQEAAEGTTGFLGISKDVDWLTNLQIVETESNAVVARERVA